MASRGLIRSLAEMNFAASLVPCPKCGAAPGRLDLYGNDGHWSLNGKCPSCGTPRQFDFDADGDPLNRPHDSLELGLDKPSQVIAPHAFLNELARLEQQLTVPPTALGPGDWQARSDDARRAATSILELCKFLPPGAAEIPASTRGDEDRALAARHPEWYSRRWLEQQRERILDRLQAFTADSPRYWRLRGKLRLVDEIRALLNQLPTKATLELGQLRRYVEARGEARPDDDVGTITVSERGGRPVAELAVRHGTFEDLEATFGRLRRTGDKATFEPKAAGVRPVVSVELSGKNVTKVTIDFAPPVN